MVSISRKYKEAQERWIQHCHDIERSTAKIPKGTEQELSLIHISEPTRPY